MSNNDKRIEILNTAIAHTGGDRNKTYGSPYPNMKITAELWSAYLQHKVEAHEVPIMLSLMKIARTIPSKTHDDNYSDGAAYLGIAAECVEEEDKEAKTSGEKWVLKINTPEKQEEKQPRKPNEIMDPEDWPQLTKDDVFQRLDEMISQGGVLDGEKLSPKQLSYHVTRRFCLMQIDSFEFHTGQKVENGRSLMGELIGQKGFNYATIPPQLGYLAYCEEWAKERGFE